MGHGRDVLNRLIHCGDKLGATDIFRITSESPFPYFEKIEDLWKEHVDNDNDATFMDNVPDGCGFELIKLDALKRSHKDGEDKHRSELCTLYIRENKDTFKVKIIDPPANLNRKDIRLTVDNPEDLIVCRAVYDQFKDVLPFVLLAETIKFLDKNKELIKLTIKYCEEGYANMYQ